MEQRLFIISDLHLGGMPPSADSPGFQMCSEAGAQRLAAFIAWASTHRSADRSLHLVLAGDVVDFLAEEEPFESFTADDERARRKLARAMDRTRLVWEALSAFVAAGNELTVMLGNHDIELALPGPRRELLQQLGRDRLERWKVEFLDDNRAFVSGPLLVEHGNRYDKWNVVPHDVLRQARSAVSRGEPIRQLPEIAGSELVAQLVNPLKKRYGFLDLLKPEDETVLSLLAVLEPTALKHFPKLVALARKAGRNTFDAQAVEGLSQRST
jgi:UDP-2,3-diacylglucosamine pyrophosphatase LpxH